MRIDKVAVLEVTGSFAPESDAPRERTCQPADIYGERPAPPPGRPRTEPIQVPQHYLQVHTDDGAEGLFGPVDRPCLPILTGEIAPVVRGWDALAGERTWDLLLRSNRHGHSGYFMMALSALDCALWDLRGKVTGQPVYRLLGGPTRDAVPAYASMLGFSLEDEPAAQAALDTRAAGYPAQKWFFRYGPSHGEDGMRRNVRLVQCLREAVGDDYPLMTDAFHSWDVPYAVQVARRIARWSPAWLEEPVRVDQVEGLRRVREQGGVPVATGEHLYGRWHVKTLLDAGAVDFMQADPDWCGGISELGKIAALCSASGVPLCCHGHSLHAALHFAAACPPDAFPYVEFLVHHQRSKQRFMQGFLEPQQGRITPPEAPGLGIVIDPEKAQTVRELA